MKKNLLLILGLLLAFAVPVAAQPQVTPGSSAVDGAGIARVGLSIPDFLKLSTVNTAAPAAGDCDAAAETGRHYWDSTNDKYYVCSGASGWIIFGPSSLFAPVGGSYLTATAESGLSGEVNLGALSTGFLFGTVAAGTSTISSQAFVPATLGGTGFTAFTVGDMFFADSTTTLAKIPAATGSGIRFLSQSTTTTTPTWQTVPSQGAYTYYAGNTASDIGGAYLVQTNVFPAGAIQYVAQTFANTTPVLMGTFATLAGTPNLTTIPAGIWRLHADAVKVSGTKTLLAYAEVYKRILAGTETLLFTTQNSQFITGSDTANPEEIDLEYTHTAVTLLLTDRIVVKWYMVQGATGGNVTGRFYYDGNTLTRLEFPSQTVDASNFIPYTGATANVNLGTYTFTGASVTAGAIATQDVIKLLPVTDDDRFTLTLSPADLSADRTVVFANLAGTVALVQGNGVVTLTDGATPALDASLGSTFYLDAAGDRTIGVPTNPVAGQKIVIVHYANAAGRTLALNSGAGGFRFGSDITALTETASGKTDYIGCIYNSVASKWDVVAVTKGY